jgi:hypothetical protein
LGYDRHHSKFQEQQGSGLLVLLAGNVVLVDGGCNDYMKFY